MLVSFLTPRSGSRAGAAPGQTPVGATIGVGETAIDSSASRRCDATVYPLLYVTVYPLLSTVCDSLPLLYVTVYPLLYVAVYPLLYATVYPLLYVTVYPLLYVQVARS